MDAYTSCNGTGWKFLQNFEIPYRPAELLGKKGVQPKRPAEGSTEVATQATLPPDEHKAVQWEGGARRKK